MNVRTRVGTPSRGQPDAIQTLITIGIASLVIVVLAWTTLGSADTNSPEVATTHAGTTDLPTVGQPPTAFAGRTSDNTPIALGDFAGQPVWLTFGGSWCRDCRVEMPELIATYEQYRSAGLVVLGVFINEPRVDTATYVARAGIPFPVVSDPSGSIASAYKLLGVPTHIFIGRDGLIKLVKIGALSPADMEAGVRAIIDGT